MPEWRHIPPLAALKAFEAAARNGSYSAAARELNVTHAAIAQHIRKLQDHFGVPLMVRNGAGMAVTDDAAALAQAVRTGFDRIEVAVRDLSDRDADRPLRIATTPSFATAWLMPRIGSFWAAHPDIRLDIAPGTQVVDLRRDRVDIAIRFGRGNWPNLQSEKVLDGEYIAVAAPSAVPQDRIGCLADLADAHWLMETQRREEFVWAAQNGLDLDRVRLSLFETNTLIIEAVLAGHGVTILPHAIVRDHIDRGELVALCAGEAGDLGYHAVTRPGRHSPAQDAFLKWLRRETRQGLRP